jgi:succinate dehydrogenase / fumarate reductase iron-sulfur subunit
VELQGGQVRLVQCRDQRQAAADVHDRMSHFAEDETITVTPLRTFPVIRDLVTDVVVQLREGARDPAFARRRTGAGRVPDAAGGRRALAGVPQVHRVLPVPEHLPRGPRPRGEQEGVRRPAVPDPVAELDMHPLDAADRRNRGSGGVRLGYCNITKCCTEVCPEHIKITDNALIPMKERVVDRKYDPRAWLGRTITRRK